MKKATGVFLLLMVLAAPDMYSIQASDEHVQSARGFIDLLNKGDFDKAVMDFDLQMKKACSADQLGALWNSLVAKFGTFVEQ